MSSNTQIITRDEIAVVVAEDFNDDLAFGEEPVDETAVLRIVELAFAEVVKLLLEGETVRIPELGTLHSRTDAHGKRFAVFTPSDKFRQRIAATPVHDDLDPEGDHP